MLKPTYTFFCPVCQKRLRLDMPYEPCCTGPHEGLDEHEMTIMVMERKDGDQVNPVLAKARSEGPLIIHPDYQ